LSHVIADIVAGRRRCRGFEGRLERLPRYKPQLKRLLAEAVADCIVELVGEDLVEEIYLVDLTGGEVAADFSGRDVDLIVLVSDKFVGLEHSLKAVLEEHINKELEGPLAFYIAESGKRDLVEVHVVTSLDMGYGRLVKSRFYPAIRLWSRRRRGSTGQVFPFPF